MRQITLSPSVEADLREIGEPIAEVLRDLAAGSEPCISHTPNGREIRLAKDGQAFLVQPANDNYWLRVPSINAAMDAFDNPVKYRD